MEDSKFFDFEKAKVQVLTLDQLRRTHKENDVYGNPLKGIYHYELIQNVVNLAKENNFNVDIYDLFAAQNKDRNTPGVVLLPQEEITFGERAVEAHILRRIYANIRLLDMDDDTYTTNIAIAFHQGGIQAGFGNMVKICHNQCMLGASNYIATYGNKNQPKVTIPDILDTIKSWLFDARRIVAEEREKIERMKQIQVSAEQAFTIIGMLTAIRVKSDTKRKEIRENKVYPLNQAQITQFTEDLLCKYQEQQRLSVWDLYNSATELYKANTMDMPNILPQNKAMVNFLEEQFM